MIKLTDNVKKRYEIQAQLLADYLPDGKFWEAKNISESDLRKLLNAFGKEFVNIEDALDWLKRETNIRTTFDLLPFWEDAYGIPDNDDIFVVEGKSIEDRRFNLYIKELMNGADRSKDWENIALQLGYVCKVYPASVTSKFPYMFPIRFLSNPRYVITVDFYGVEPPSVFPLQFDFTFGESKILTLQKIFNIIKPADCDIVYNYIR